MSTFKRLPVPNGGTRRGIVGPFMSAAALPDAGEYKNEIALVLEADVLAIYISTGANWTQGVPSLIGVDYSVVGTDITITGSTTGDASAGVFGVEYSINAAVPPYPFSVNVPGAAVNQSITIGASEGITSGDTVRARAYINLNPLDPISSRIYGTPTLTVAVP